MPNVFPPSSKFNKVIFAEICLAYADCTVLMQGSHVQMRMNFSNVWGPLSSSAAGLDTMAGITDIPMVHSTNTPLVAQAWLDLETSGF